MRFGFTSAPRYSEKGACHPWPFHHLTPVSGPVSGVGQLVDSNCSVIFDKSKVQVLHKNAKILEGRQNLKNGLWTVDLQSDLTAPQSDHTYSKLGLSNSIFKNPDTAKPNHQWSAVGKSNKDTTYPHGKFCQANSVCECSNKKDLVRFFHAAAFSPLSDTWIKVV
jgi:hypothetical protein